MYWAVYFAICFLYLYGLSSQRQKQFQTVVKYFKGYQDFIPLSFILGFFVAIVMKRWWDQYLTIPWPYTIAVYVSSTIQGYDEVGRALRRTIMRYVCLALTMVFRVLSSRVKARFPKMSDLVDAGLLTENELGIIEALDQKFPKFGKNWLPIVWAASLVNRAREEGRIRDDFAAKQIIEELAKFRARCGILLDYNKICIPLVYTQVVTIAVYFYLLVILIAMQTVQENDDEDLKFNLKDIPLLETLQFLFYMGWLKVAETMLNPFGDDDDDFEVNFMVDRNIQMSYLIVDEMHREHPELLKDQHWNEIPKSLPDRMPEDKKKKEEDKATDIFDVVPSATRRKTLLVDVLQRPPVDVEMPEDKIEPRKSLNLHLIPQATIIDKTYQNKQNADVLEAEIDLAAHKFQMARKSFASIRRSLVFDDTDDDSDNSTMKKLKTRSVLRLRKEQNEDQSNETKPNDETTSSPQLQESPSEKLNFETVSKGENRSSKDE